MKKQSRRGQAFMEYLLFLVIVASVLIGVVFPKFRGRMEELQAKIRANATKTISQEEMGIPACWFFCGDGGGEQKQNAFLAGLGKTGNTNVNSASMSNDLGGPSSGGGVGGTGTSRAASGGLGPSRRGGGSGGAGGGGASDVDSDPGRERDAPSKNTNRGGAEVGGPVNTAGTISADAQTAGEKTQVPNDGGGPLMAGKKGNLRQEDRRTITQSCQDIDFWTLIKIVAILGIVIIGIILGLSNRGTQGKR